jgi:hypothetical protein
MAESPLLTEVEEQSLSTELSRDVLESLAPDELPFFDDVVTDLRHQRKVIPDTRRRDEPLGFGTELSLLAPYVVTVMPAVVHFLSDVLASVAEQEAAAGLEAVIRRLFRRPSDGPARVNLTAEQGRQVREVTRGRAIAVGLDRERAELLADAVVGALSVAGTDDR